MPLIVPVLPTPAAPPSEAPAPASVSAQSDASPRFSDALSRAGQSQQATGSTGSAKPQSQDVGEAATPANAPAPGTAKDTKSQPNTTTGQSQAQDGVANSAASAALASQASGRRDAAMIDAPGGKNLPHDSRKTDAAAAPQSAAPGQQAALLLNVPFAAPAAASQETAKAAVTGGAAAISQGLAQRSSAALTRDTAAEAADASRPAHQTARSDGASPLPAWMEGLAASGAEGTQASRFATVHQALTSVSQTVSLPETPATHSEQASPSTAPGQMAQSLSPAWVQPAPMPQPAGMAAVNTPMHSPDWGQAMSQQVLLAAQGQQQFATLHLNPPQLGPLQVHLQLHDGQIQAQFVSPHAVVRQAVEAALPQLRDLFTGAGLSLMQTSVGTQGGQGGRQQARSERGSAGLAAIAGGVVDSAASTQSTPALRWQQGMVNTYV